MTCLSSQSSSVLNDRWVFRDRILKCFHTYLQICSKEQDVNARDKKNKNKKEIYKELFHNFIFTQKSEFSNFSFRCYLFKLSGLPTFEMFSLHDSFWLFEFIESDCYLVHISIYISIDNPY